MISLINVRNRYCERCAAICEPRLDCRATLAMTAVLVPRYRTNLAALAA
ncbi:MAG: hypothetical protein HOP25_02300 [Methylotenera sp.]|nr:hypothetical protein [Methylotenera sp.]